MKKIVVTMTVKHCNTDIFGVPKGLPTSPKNDGIVFCFKRLPLFGWFSANFYGQVFPLCISHYEIKLELKNKGRVFRIS